MPTPLEQRRERLIGTLLGGAVGDALGLPFEGLSARRAARLFPGPLGHRLFFGRGMCSDDTEHACMTAQALIRGNGDVDRFRRSLAWRLRGWLLALPAGVGLATLRAIAKLWLGFPPHRSGVHSAGNGPAMRATVIGVHFCDQAHKLKEFVEASTLLTHRDPRAVRGAVLIALAAATAARSAGGRIDPKSFLADAMATAEGDRELLALLVKVDQELEESRSPQALRDALSPRDGVSGYIYHTVPICLLVWLRHPTNFRAAVAEIISLGGDTDTTAAIVGGLVGATAGVASVPSEWLDGLLEYPRSISWMRRLGSRLAEAAARPGSDVRPMPLAWYALVPRNLLFLAIVLSHGVRRLFPPY